MLFPRCSVIVTLIIALAAAGCSPGSSIAPHTGSSSSGGTLQTLLVHSDTISMKHVLTWDAMDGTGNAVKITALQAAPWLDYALTIPATSVLVKAAGIKSALYMNPNRQAPGGPMYSKHESEFAHTCSQQRIKEYHPDPKAYYTDPHSATLQSLWIQALAAEVAWGAVYDFVFEDNADAAVPQNMTGTPCNFTWNSWTNATNSLDNALGAPIIGNALGYILPNSDQPGPGIGINPSTAGNMAEDCYVGRTPTGYYFAPHWLATENTEIQMAQANKLFVCHADWYDDASTSVAQRIYLYASILLTYKQSTQVVDTEFGTPSGLHVMPEAQLIPANPRVPAPANIQGLMQPSGVYGREYANCYLAGSGVGPCAVVVNPNNPQSGPPLAFPWPSTYHHTLTVRGRGVYDGGTVNLTGPAPPANMAGGTAVIAFP